MGLQAQLDALPVGEALVISPGSYVLDAPALTIKDGKSLLCPNGWARIRGQDTATPGKLIFENNTHGRLSGVEIIGAAGVQGDYAVYFGRGAGPNSRCSVERVRVGWSGAGPTATYAVGVGSDAVDNGNDYHNIKDVDLRYCTTAVHNAKGQHTSWYLERVSAYGATTFLKFASNVMVRNCFVYGAVTVFRALAADAVNLRKLAVEALECEASQTLIDADAQLLCSGRSIGFTQNTAVATNLVRLGSSVSNNSQQVTLEGVYFTKGGSATSALLTLEIPQSGSSDKQLLISGRSSLKLKTSYPFHSEPWSKAEVHRQPAPALRENRRKGSLRGRPAENHDSLVACSIAGSANPQSDQRTKYARIRADGL